MTTSFKQEFYSLQYIINRARRVLLIAHTRPDPDTVGAVIALQTFFASRNIPSDITCYSAFPQSFSQIVNAQFLPPDAIHTDDYNIVIGCDSVERGFHLIAKKIKEDQVTVILDHHPDINIKADITIIDPLASSTCEIIYLFMLYAKIPISRSIATALLFGIMGDTGNFQHSNTSTRVLEIASDLLKRGAPLQKITNYIFSNKKLSALKLWGRAFEKAKLYNNGMICTVITAQDLRDARATHEDTQQVANILATVPGAKFSLVLTETDTETIKASLRSEAASEVDVSAIAHQFGGGGHQKASGFEIPGKLIETSLGWAIQ